MLRHGRGIATVFRATTRDPEPAEAHVKPRPPSRTGREIQVEGTANVVTVLADGQTGGQGPTARPSEQSDEVRDDDDVPEATDPLRRSSTAITS